MNLRKKLMIGTASGLLFTLGVLLALVVGGASVVTGLGKMDRGVRHSEKTLIDAFGTIDDYIPPVGGVPSHDRISTFLSVRQRLSDERRLLQLVILQFRSDSAPVLAGLLDQMRIAVLANSRLVQAYTRYWEARNLALLEQGMGLGEYVYLYSLIYYAWLSYDPLDGYAPDGLPVYGYPGGPREWPDLDEVDQVRLDHIQTAGWQQVQQLLLPMLEKIQLAEVDTTDGRRWLDQEAVRLEIERLRESSARVPWRTDLPRPLADAFRPFRKNLEDNYALAANPVELVFVRN